MPIWPQGGDRKYFKKRLYDLGEEVADMSRGGDMTPGKMLGIHLGKVDAHMALWR